jgi:hypothetical protein
MSILNITEFAQQQSAHEFQADAYARPALQTQAKIDFSGGAVQSGRLHPQTRALKLSLDVNARVLFYNYDWAIDPTGATIQTAPSATVDELFLAGTHYLRIREGVSRLAVIIPA